MPSSLFVNLFEMEKDECNIMAAKAFHARLNGDKKSAVEYERDLEGLRSGKRRRVDQCIEIWLELIVDESKEEDGKVEIVTPLDEHGNLLPALMKQVCLPNEINS